MINSMYSGVSGVQAHQEKMNVVSNNIVNVNTNGFKASRVVMYGANPTIEPPTALCPRISMKKILECLSKK